ncbi:MAG: FtsH protease activity modulator HflK [Clostridiales bacterium]|nr:FtsH protease activity modulator HflK [Clostridiales bacterium]
MKNGKIVFLVIIIAIAAFIGMQSYYFIENAEQAVVQRFGEVVEVKTQSGLNFKIPFIDKVTIFKTNEILSIQYGYRPKDDPTTTTAGTYVSVEDESIVLTKGSYLVNVGAVIQYRITDPAQYLINVDDQIGTIRLAFESVLRSNMQNKELEQALINKEIIAREIQPELSKKLASYGSGITITDVKFTDVLLPESVQFSYDDVNNAENQKTQYLSQAARYENEKLPEARAEAYQRIQSAEAYKAQKVSQAKGDVENFLQVYEKYAVAKEITKTRLYLETMENILSTVQYKYIIDMSSDGTIKYLPLNPETLSKGGTINE